MGEGFLPFAPARSERGELWAAPLLVLLASSRRTTARAADGHGRRGVLSHVLLDAPLPSRFFFPLSSSLGGVSSPASLHILLLRGGTVVRVFQDVNVAALQGAVPPSCSRFAWAGGTPRRVKRMRTTVVAG